MSPVKEPVQAGGVGIRQRHRAAGRAERLKRDPVKEVGGGLDFKTSALDSADSELKRTIGASSGGGQER